MPTPSNDGYGPKAQARAKYGFEALLRYAYSQGIVPDGVNIVSLSFEKNDLLSTNRLVVHNGLDGLRKRTGAVESLWFNKINLSKKNDKDYYAFIYQSFNYLKDLNLINSESYDYNYTTGKFSFSLNILNPIVSSLTGTILNQVINDWINANLASFDRKWETFLKSRDAEKERLLHINENMERMNNYLLRLNYDDQRHYLDSQIDSLDSIQISKAEIDGKLIIQEWLVYRALRTNDVLRNSALKYRKMSSHSLYREPTLIKLFIDNGDFSEYIGQCCENENSSTVLFVVCGMEVLPAGGLNLFLADFNRELSTLIGRNSEIARKKFRVLLVGKSGWISQQNNSALTPVKESWGALSDIHIQQWMPRIPVSQENNATVEDFLKEMAEISKPTAWVDWRTWIDISSLENTFSSLCREFLREDNSDKLNAIWHQKLGLERVVK